MMKIIKINNKLNISQNNMTDIIEKSRISL